MIIVQPYHFDPFYSNRLFYFKVITLSIATRFRKFINNNLHSLKTGIIAGLYRDLGKIYLMVEGLKSVLDTIDLSQAKDEHRYAEKALVRFRRYYYLLEEASFLNHEGIKETATQTLLELYAIESKLRFLSFESPNENDTDDELRKAASLISLNTISKLHAV